MLTKKNKRVVRNILQKGMTQSAAYQDVYKGAMSTARSNSSKMMRKPEVQEYYNAIVEVFKAKDIQDIAKRVVKDAKKTNKTIVTKDGTKYTIPDNTATLQSRDQLFKLIQAPGFSSSVTHIDKQTNVLNNQQLHMDISPQALTDLSTTLDRLERLSSIMLDREEIQDGEVVDVGINK